MKKKKIFLHLLSFLFFTFLFVYWLLNDKSKSNIDIYGLSTAYILFAFAPVLSLALQYEVSKDRAFFKKFTNSTTEDLEMSDYLRISFLLFYNLGAYAGVKLRKIVLKKEYRKTDIKHIELIEEIINRKKSLLFVLIVQLLLITIMFSSYFFIR